MYERNYHDSVLTPEKPKKKRQSKKAVWKTVALSFLCVLIVGGFITATLLNRLQLQVVNVVGVDSADPKDVSQFVLNSLEGKWLYVFPKTSIVLLPDSSLEKNIRKAFPKFASVSVSRSGARTATVSVSEYEGTYLWCTEADGSCSFMSRDGIVFAPAPFFSGNAYIKIFIGEPDAYPFSPIAPAELSNVTFLLERLRDISIEPSEFHYYYGPDRTEIVFYHNGGAARLITDPNIPSDTTLQSLFTAIKTAPLSTKFHDGVSVLEYIDLRLPNKIVYKFK